MNFSPESFHNNHSLEAANKEEPGIETIETEPRFTQIQEDLEAMFTISIKSEDDLENRYIKDDFYRKVKEDLENDTYFSLHYMAYEKLHKDEGEPLMTKEDFVARGIRSLQDHGKNMLHKYKGVRLSEIKKLFVLSGMFTENEIAEELEKSPLL